MSENVYNIIWADDEIDNLYDDLTRDELSEKGFNVIAIAHNGLELEEALDRASIVDAVIIDANFNEAQVSTNNERDTSGLDYARSLYTIKYHKKIPFFLYSARSEELLNDIYKNNKLFLEDFPRNKRWFSKTIAKEFNEMLEAIKKEVNLLNTSSFIIRNRYHDELMAASIIDKQDTMLNFLICDYEDTLLTIEEPFVQLRRIIETIYDKCQRLKLIPPIADDVNGTTNFLFYNNYRKGNIDKYKMTCPIMKKPLAQSLIYVVNLTQDGAHSKGNLKLDVDYYYKSTKDTLMLRSVLYIIIDVLKWFGITALNNRDVEVNQTRWEEI